MGLGDWLEVVGLVGVREHAVGERGVACRRLDVSREDGRFADAALRAHEANDHFAGLEPRTRHHCAEGVEDRVPDISYDLRRQRRVRASTMYFATRLVTSPLRALAAVPAWVGGTMPATPGAAEKAVAASVPPT